MQRRDIWHYIVTFLLALGCTLVAVFAALYVRDIRTQTHPTHEKPLLIDAGHGGKDGGAVAADGTVEKEINLAIALPLADMLRVFGYPVELTRETDVMLCDEGLSSLRQQKNSDMRNRLEMFNGSRLTVSIHQNHFSQPQYWGMQIFYGTKHSESHPLAESVRETVLDMLQPDNKRELKKASKDIFLAYNAQTPVILVECGFLSNLDERARLKEPQYQQQMAYAIACGILAYVS